MELDYTTPRKNFIDFVKKSLIGPGHKFDSISDDFTIVSEYPSKVYSTAILFPITQDSGRDRIAEREIKKKTSINNFDDDAPF
jgi:hypothetical protein